MPFSGRLRLLGQRLLAFLLDWLIMLAYIALLVGAVLAVRMTPLAPAYNNLFANPNSAETTAFLLLVLPVLLYFTLFESSPRRATPGKRRMGLMVADGHGERIGIGRALLRNALKLVPWELAHASIWRIPGGFAGGAKAGLPVDVQIGLVSVYAVAAIYATSVLVTPHGQTLYDLLSRTYVRSRQP